MRAKVIRTPDGIGAYVDDGRSLTVCTNGDWGRAELSGWLEFFARLLDREAFAPPSPSGARGGPYVEATERGPSSISSVWAGG